jgi:hypothetical protein
MEGHRMSTHHGTLKRMAKPGLLLTVGASMGGGVAAAPARPDETIGLPAAIIAPATPAQTVPVAPASNYRALRDTDNRYFWVSGGNISYIDWAPAQVKVNYSNRSYLIGTDGADSFDSGYHAATPSHIINSGLLANFLAGGGDDIFGGSARADNLWGGLGNDTAYGYAGDDRLYGEEGNDALLGQAGSDILLGGLGLDELQGGDGSDQLLGEDGNDNLFGQTGDDALWGGAGDWPIAGRYAACAVMRGRAKPEKAANDPVPLAA